MPLEQINLPVPMMLAPPPNSSFERDSEMLRILVPSASLRLPLNLDVSRHLFNSRGSHDKTISPIAISAAEVPARIKPSLYPEPFASQMAGRAKSVLGDLFSLKNFGVNLTRLAPNAVSALRHAHAKQDEFIYILQGRPTLHTDEGRAQLSLGMCAGFKAGTGNGHRLINETAEEVVYLEVGDRTAGDEATYPDDDLKALQVEGNWLFVHKDGRPY